MAKATITAVWLNKKVTFEAEWEKKCIESDATERLYFSDEFDKLGNEGEEPELDIHLNSNPAIKSRVHFEPESGELYSTRSLNVLLEKNKDPEIG